LTVTDNQGYSGTSSVMIRTDNNPPVAEAQASPVSGPAPLTVNFEGIQSYDPDGKVRSFSWDFGDGTNERTTSTSHQYRDPGSYTAELTVTDDLGATGNDGVVITVGNEPPVAVIGISAKSGSVPLKVTFDGSRSFDPDGIALTYSWDFGDGTTGTSKTTSHTYEEEGTFDISLVVTDMHGASGRAEETVIAESPVLIVPLIGGALIIAGAAIALWYIRQQIVKRRRPSPEFHITTYSGLEYETGMKRTSDEIPDISVEVRSGIWKEGDKR
ncbi:MAG TPA: PKD domain-containing protein, partial [Methanoregulaceae archaeon]|nr:PKD domain-containing protein [Methanoregulaceae archaeon]